MGAHLSTHCGAKAAPSCRSSAASRSIRLSGERIDVVCPSDGLAFAVDPRLGQGRCRPRRERPRARAFDAGPWSRMPAFERGRCLTAARPAGREERRRARRAGIARHRQAGPPGPRRRRRRRRAISNSTAAPPTRSMATRIPFLDGYTALTLREPHGVVGRHRPVELSAANPRPRRRRRARDGQYAGRSSRPRTPR